MSKAGTAYVDIDARLDNFRRDMKKATTGLKADLDLDVDRSQIMRHLTGLKADLALDIDRSKISSQLAGIDAQVNVGVDDTTLAAARLKIETALSGIWVDINTRLDATTLAALQAQLAALNAQAAGIGGAAAAGGFGSKATMGAGVGAVASVASVFTLGGLGLSVAADNEAAALSFERLLGSAEAAQAFLLQMQDFAAKTPFEFPELRDSASRLLAVGTEADRVIPIMTTLGDATSAMGTGQEGVARAITALTQMSQKGKVSAEEMLQLTEAGIPAWDALAAVLNTDVATAMDMVQKRQVDAESVFTAIETQAGPAFARVAGGMEDLSGTLKGQLSTLKDEFMMGLGDLAMPLLGSLKEMLGPIKDGLIKPLMDALGPAMEQIAPLVKTIADNAGPLLATLVQFGGDLMASLQPALDILMPVITDLVSMLGDELGEVLVALTPTFEELARTLVELSPLIPPVAELLSTVLIEAAPLLTKMAEGLTLTADAVARVLGYGFEHLVRLVKDLLNGDFEAVRDRIWYLFESFANGVNIIREKLVDFYTNIWGKFVDTVKNLPGEVASALGGMWDFMVASFQAAVNAIVGIWNRLRVPEIGPFGPWGPGDIIPQIGPFGPFDLPDLPTFHSGGLVPGRTGEEVLAKLQAGEIVVPVGAVDNLAAMAAAGGSQRPISVVQNIDGGMSPELIAEAATRRLGRALAVAS